MHVITELLAGRKPDLTSKVKFGLGDQFHRQNSSWSGNAIEPRENHDSPG